MKKFLISLLFVFVLTFMQILAFNQGESKKASSVTNEGIVTEAILISNPEIDEIEFDMILEIEEKDVRLFIPEENKILKIPIEDYVIGVLMGEMYKDAHEEALKAMAVAARTYTIYMMNESKGKEYDLAADSTVSQAYVPRGAIIEVSNEENSLYATMKNAVEKTRGQILTYNSDPICALYHASSYMFTENCENVFVEKLPYLSAVASFEGESEVYSSSTEYSISDFNKLLKENNFPEFDEETLKIERIINNNNRCELLFIKDSEKGIVIDGKSARNIFKLRSTSFEVKLTESKIVFSSKGFGHGVGLSQNGSVIMANKGKSYEEILKHYYKGAKVSKTIYK